MKILVFENDYEAVKLSFNLLNIVYHSGSLVIHQSPRFQDAGTIENIMSYDFIFVDIDLALGSKLDGYQIIRLLLEKKYPLGKIAILTGHRNMRSRLKEQGIDESIKIVFKALTSKSLQETLQTAFA